jgi:hypothetical protein
MSNAAHEAELRITRPAADNLRIDCLVELLPDDGPEFPRDQTPSLVMDRSRPTVVGWRWDPPRNSGPEEMACPHGLVTAEPADRRQIGFSYALPDAKEADAFFPIGESTYHAEAEIDSEPRTVWFPLPPGRSLHQLGDLLGIDEETLVNFVADWFAEQDSRSALPFDVDVNVYVYGAEGVRISCLSKTTDAFEGVDIPAELLRDPIRNGSEYLEHGFNPWNEGQKAEIVAHLERELPRLTDFFQRDARSRMAGVPSV